MLETRANACFLGRAIINISESHPVLATYESHENNKSQIGILVSTILTFHKLYISVFYKCNECHRIHRFILNNIDHPYILCYCIPYR